jgi:uncharacterized pyridoxamine 5'-phosphate oxidase family protein
VNKEEMLAFITKNPMCYMATVEGNKPRVRAMGTHRSDENGIIYFTDHRKEVCKQLVANPEIEVCYYADELQVRVSGRVEEIKDREFKQEIVDNHPVLKTMGIELDLDTMAAFRLDPVEASVMQHPELKTPIEL